ncbi:hypothetical protein TWF730_003945 [Orbilia blumenaviensis]|uniref:Uncharacterized protein n=1 Tax=Orbilia blumenaviensis TaxID=1796055 RepID=A0AAV9U1D0_9PEZI
MATVNVNLETVVYTNLKTPTPWAPTRTKAPRAMQPDGTKLPAPMENERLKGYEGMVTETTSTHTFSIITNGLVVATFTAVGTIASPPRGIPPPPDALPPWEIIIIILSAALFCFILIRAFYHHRRLEMIIRKEDEAKGTTDAIATTKTHKTGSGDDRAESLKMEDVLIKAPATKKSGTNTKVSKISTKYIPRDACQEDGKD